MTMVRTIVVGIEALILAGCTHSTIARKVGSDVVPPAMSIHDFDQMRPKLTGQLTLDRAESVLGKPNRVTGSGLTIYVYALEGGRELWLGFAKRLIYAFEQDGNGHRTDIKLSDE